MANVVTWTWAFKDSLIFLFRFKRTSNCSAKETKRNKNCSYPWTGPRTCFFTVNPPKWWRQKKKKNHGNFVSPICLRYRLLIRDQFGWILKYEFRESALPKWLFQTKMAHPRRTTEMISWKNVFFKLKWLTSCWISGLGTFSFSVLTDPILCPSPKLVWRADWVIYLSFQLTRLRGLASKCLPQTKMGDFLFNFRDGCLRLFPFLLLWSTWPPNFMVIGGTVVRGRIFKCDHWLKWLEKSCFTPKCPTSCSISVMGPWNSW